MGTRGLTYVYDENENPLVCMYRQYDSYPSGHGRELANFLKSGKLTNGLFSTLKDEKVFNGMECLAAQMVAFFKTDVGNIYLKPFDLNQDYYQEYEYHVRDNNVTLYEGNYTEGHVKFFGSWNEFYEYVNTNNVTNVPVNVPFVDNQINRDWLKGLLHETELKVVFTKKDGTERTLKCTLNEDIVPPTGDKQRTVNKNESVQPVYDTENSSWRSFRWDSVRFVLLGNNLQ